MGEKLVIVRSLLHEIKTRSQKGHREFYLSLGFQVLGYQYESVNVIYTHTPFPGDCSRNIVSCFAILGKTYNTGFIGIVVR